MAAGIRKSSKWTLSWKCFVKLLLSQIIAKWPEQTIQAGKKKQKNIERGKTMAHVVNLQQSLSFTLMNSTCFFFAVLQIKTQHFLMFFLIKSLPKKGRLQVLHSSFIYDSLLHRSGKSENI